MTVRRKQRRSGSGRGSPMIKVIGVGDNVVDCYIHQNTMYPGGNCVNIAAFSRQLGHQSAYLGVLADDRQADVLRRALTDMGVDFSMCPTMHGETGRCSTNLVEGDRVIGDDNDLGLCKSNPLQITDEMLEYIKGFDVVHSSCYSFIEDQLCKIKSTGVPIVYDFSDGWEEKDFERVCPNIDVAFFSGKKLPDEEIKGYLKKCVDELGCRLAMCTIGKRGAFIYNGHKFFIKPPYNLEGKVTDTMGAGDSFLTGFMTTYFDGQRIFEAMVKGEPQKYTTEADRLDYEESLIEYSMSMGNLIAIRNCFVSGAFGHGEKIN